MAQDIEKTLAFAAALRLARDWLMSGPKATPPRYRAMRKIALRMLAKKTLMRNGRPVSWRAFPKERKPVPSLAEYGQ